MVNCSLDLLAKKKCKPCEGGVAPLPKAQCQKYLRELKGWRLDESAKSIQADYLMKDFLAAVDLIGRIAKVAQKEDHHPDLHLTGYRKLRVELSTHAIDGLSENDFILAARIERLPKKLKV